MSFSQPYNPANIISPDLSDDNKFKQLVEFVKQSFLSSGWAEVLDAGYAQQWANSMAFSTASNNNLGVNTGGTSTASPTQYPNLGMDNQTTTFWQSNGQPILGSANYAIGYDAGIGNTVSPAYYNLWIAGNATITDPTCWVMEYCDTMDANYDWAGSAWIPCSSKVNCTSGSGACSVASVSLTPGGTGWIVNTTATVGVGGGATTTTTATFTIATGSVTMSVTSSASFSPGNYLYVNDGSHTAHYQITATATGTITATYLGIAGDNTSGTMGSAANVWVCGLGAVVQPVITSGAVSGLLLVEPGVGYHTGDALAFQVASAGSGATATVNTVNAAGQILTLTLGAGGSSYVANPVVTASGGTGTSTYAVFTNAAIGVSGQIQQVIPCVGSGNYTTGTAPTMGTITQATGGSTPTSAPTCTAHITSSTGALTRFDIATLYWASVGTPVGPTHRAFRLRLLANVSSTTSVNIYEFQLTTFAGVYINNTPSRMSPTNLQISTKTAFKVFQMQDTIQTASGGSGCPVFVRVDFGSSTTWSFPSIWLTLGSGTDGSGNIVGAQTTPIMQLSAGVGSSSVLPFWTCGNTDWIHIELFKGTNSEICFHIERNQTSSGADDPTAGASCFGATASVTSSMVQPQFGAAPGMETKWGAILGTNAGSTNGAITQISPVLGRNLGFTYPLRRLFVCEATSGLPDATVTTITDSYGNSISAYVGGKNCLGVSQTGSTGRMMVKNAQ